MSLRLLLKNVALGLFALLFLGGGIMHFARSDFYLPMMPDYLPWHLPLIYLSGIGEFALGALLLWPKTRRLAAFGLIALLVAVFPANLNMALNAAKFPDMAPLALWIRLPIQGLLIAWAYAYTRKPKPAGLADTAGMASGR